MQKGMVYYFVIITMLSILLKEMYKELRKVYLYPKDLMKTLIYKPFVRGLYIFVCSLFILGGTIYINYLPRILTADFKEIHGKIYEKEIIAQNGYILCDMTFESGENIVAYMDKENVNDIKGKKVEICDVDFDYIGNFVKKIDGKYPKKLIHTIWGSGWMIKEES